MNNYNDIDFLLNILYHRVYTGGDCYRINQIYRRGIVLDDIKKSPTFDPSDIFDRDYVYDGFYSDRWHFKTDRATLSIGRYSSNVVNDLQSKELYNIAMLYMASEIVLLEGVNHTLLPIMFFDILASELDPKFTDNMEVSSGDKMYVLITERFYEMTTLAEYMKSGVDLDTWKIIIFQILFALFKLGERFRLFRHNRLTPYSLRIMTHRPQLFRYKIGDTLFEFESGLTVKIADFDYSSTTDYHKNFDAPAYEDNPYYDVYFLFSRLKDEPVLNSFINYVIPLNIDTETISSRNPRALLMNMSFFHSLSKTPMEKVSQYNNMITGTRKLHRSSPDTSSFNSSEYDSEISRLKRETGGSLSSNTASVRPPLEQFTLNGLPALDPLDHMSNVQSLRAHINGLPPPMPRPQEIRMDVDMPSRLGLNNMGMLVGGGGKRYKFGYKDGANKKADCKCSDEKKDFFF